jgi:mono/diheme cytochrome c family protein
MKRNRPYSALVLAVMVFIIAVVSCQHEPIVGSGSSNSGNNNNPPFTGVCFESDLLPLIQSSCGKGTNCHGVGSKEGVLVSYETIMAFDKGEGIRPFKPFESDIFKKVDKNEMPKGADPWTSAQKEMLKDWIVQGAIDTKNCATCDTNKFTYKAVASIIAKKCISCHEVGNASNRNVRLKEYQDVKSTVVNKTLIPAIEHTGPYKMPAPPLKKLEDCEITVIKKWISDGYKDN